MPVTSSTIRTPASLRSDRDRLGVGMSDRDQIGITDHLRRNQHLFSGVGKMDIGIEGGKHSYVFDYTLTSWRQTDTDRATDAPTEGAPTPTNPGGSCVFQTKV